jgi:hypothetical protein
MRIRGSAVRLLGKATQRQQPCKISISMSFEETLSPFFLFPIKSELCNLLVNRDFSLERRALENLKRSTLILRGKGELLEDSSRV